MGKQTKV